MKTIIRTRNQLETVTDHREPIPVDKSGRVDYDAMLERIEQVYRERVKRDLCQIY